MWRRKSCPVLHIYIYEISDPDFTCIAWDTLNCPWVDIIENEEVQEVLTD